MKYSKTLPLFLALLISPCFARFTSVDPAREFVNTYAYVGNNPISKNDPTGMVERDANGKIKWQPLNHVEKWPDFPDFTNPPQYSTRHMQKGLVKANDGKTQVTMWKLLQGACGAITDCHGVSFGDSTYWINDQDVDTLLKADGYTRTSNPKVGDVLVYRAKTDIIRPDANGKPTLYYTAGSVMHSLTVMDVDSSGNVTKLAGLGGVHVTVKSETEQSGWITTTQETDYEYWTRPASEMQGFKEGLHDYANGRGKVEPDVLQTFQK